MSRGLGKVQREVLRLVEEAPAGRRGWAPPHSRTIAELAAAVYGPTFTDTQRRAIARAVATLEARGLVLSGLYARQFREVSGETRTHVVDFIEGYHPEPTTSKGKVYRRAGLYELTVSKTHKVPVPETFVWRPRQGSALPTEVVEADRALSAPVRL
jgi:hypothetical protein